MIRKTFGYLATRLRDSHPDLAYLHVVKPRISGASDQFEGHSETESNDFLREIWGNRPFISAGGYDRARGIKVAQDKGGLVAYGRHYIPNVCQLDVMLKIY